MLFLALALIFSLVAMIPQEERLSTGTLKNEKIRLNETFSEIRLTGLEFSKVTSLDIFDRENTVIVRRDESQEFNTSEIIEITITGEVKYEYISREYPYSLFGIPAFIFFVVGTILTIRSVHGYIGEIVEEVREEKKKRKKNSEER